MSGNALNWVYADNEMAKKQKKCHLHFCKWHFGTL